MNKSQHQLQSALADSMQVNLSGLSEKRAKKLHKTIAKAARKIAEKYARLLGKERQGNKKAALVTTQVALDKATLRATKAATKRLSSGARAPQKKPAVLALQQA
jgi:ribosomal protein S17E